MQDLEFRAGLKVSGMRETQTSLSKETFNEGLLTIPSLKLDTPTSRHELLATAVLAIAALSMCLRTHPVTLRLQPLADW